MKTKCMPRYLAVAVSAALILSMTACGGSPSNSTSGTDASGGSDESSVKTVSYTMMDYIAGNASDVPETTLVQDELNKMIEEKLGYKVEVEHQYVHMGDYAEKLKVLFAGGDIPDVVHCGWYEMSEINKFGEQGMFVDFTEYKDKMSNMFNTIAKDSTFESRGYSTDGALYIAPDAIIKKGGNYDSYTCGAYRKDILDECGLTVPTTLDELYDTAVALKEKYPDVYPIMTLEEWEPLENAVYHSYGIGSHAYFNGEEFVYAAFQDGYKDAVEYLNKLYTEGLISPDYQTHTSEQGMAAVASGEAFLIPQIWNGYPAQWSTEYPDQEWVLVPVLSNDEVSNPPFIYHPTSDDIEASSGYFTVISNKSEVKDELMQIYDLYYTEEFMMTKAWGIEGVTYEYDEEGEPHIIDKEKYSDVNTGTNSASDSRIDNVELATSTKIFYQGKMREDKLYNFWRDVYSEEVETPYYDSVTLSTDENEEFANIMTAVDTYADEQTSKFITGARPMEEWDAFIEELQGMGDIQKALDLKNSKLK